jgi:hypothetical protein
VYPLQAAGQLRQLLCKPFTALRSMSESEEQAEHRKLSGVVRSQRSSAPEHLQAAQWDAAACQLDALQPVHIAQHGSPVRQADAAGAPEFEQEAPGAEGCDDSAEDVRACLFSLLQRKCPELRITCNALGMLEGLLNEVLPYELSHAVITGCVASPSLQGLHP